MSEVKRGAAFVPAHISGFFQPCFSRTPERTGSRNCGPCLEEGVVTEVVVRPAARTAVEISINGRRAPKAETTSAAVAKLLRRMKGSLEVRVNHQCQVPVGGGYGASGAGALGVVLALSRASRLWLSREELAKIAHFADVTCRTGLGDVGAQVLGGLVIGLQPGGPPHGRWERIPVPRDLRVICATVGPLSTRKFLSDPQFRRRAGKLGEQAMEMVLERPTPEGFMMASREFAEGLGLLDEELRELIQAAESAGAIGASQVMLGRAVFALARGSKAKRVRDVFSDALSPDRVMVSAVDLRGARLL